MPFFSRHPPPFGRKQFPGTVSGKRNHALPKWATRSRYRFQELKQTPLTSVFLSDPLTSSFSVRSYHSQLLILLPGSLTSHEVQREALPWTARSRHQRGRAAVLTHGDTETRCMTNSSDKMACSLRAPTSLEISWKEI